MVKTSATVTAIATVIADADGKAINGAIAYLQSPDLPTGFLFAITNGDGYACWQQVPVPFTGVLQLAAAAAPYGPNGNGEPVEIPEDANNLTLRVGPSTANAQDLLLPPASFRKPAGGPYPTIHGRLHGEGIRLVDTHGPWKWKMVTGFDALRLVSVGEEALLKTYFEWVASVGGNGLRVFGNWIVTGLDFRTTENYFGHLRRLADLTYDAGMRIEFCCVCDYIPPTQEDQQAFIDDVCAVCADYEHIVVVYGNEPYQNMVDPTLIQPPDADVLQARGMCNPNDPLALPYLPSAGFTTYQTVRADNGDWARKVGKDGYEIHHGFGGDPAIGKPDFPGTHDAVINTEAMGAANTYQDGRRSNRPDEFFMAGVAAAMFTSGMTGHGDSLTMQRCVVPIDPEAACIAECFRGVDIVPIDAPIWDYCRYGLYEERVPVEPDAVDVANGDDVRIHCKVGPTQAVSINYRYLLEGHQVWQPKGINGWKTVLQDGPYVLSELA